MCADFQHQIFAYQKQNAVGTATTLSAGSSHAWSAAGATLWAQVAVVGPSRAAAAVVVAGNTAAFLAVTVLVPQAVEHATRKTEGTAEGRSMHKGVDRDSRTREVEGTKLVAAAAAVAADKVLTTLLVPVLASATAVEVLTVLRVPVPVPATAAAAAPAPPPLHLPLCAVFAVLFLCLPVPVPFHPMQVPCCHPVQDSVEVIRAVLQVDSTQ